MEQEWEMYLMAAPICFIGVPVSYLFVGMGSTSVPLYLEIYNISYILWTDFKPFQRFRSIAFS